MREGPLDECRRCIEIMASLELENEKLHNSLQKANRPVITAHRQQAQYLDL